MIEPIRKPDGQSGFQNLMTQRASLHKWKTIKTLLNHGSNREAIAIVESFQTQMTVEQTVAKVAAAAGITE